MPAPPLKKKRGAGWKHKLLIRDLHEQYQKKEIDVKTLAKEVIKRLETLPIKDEDAIVEARSVLGEVEDIEAYDDALEILYDYGDVERRLWVDAVVTNL